MADQTSDGSEVGDSASRQSDSRVESGPHRSTRLLRPLMPVIAPVVIAFAIAGAVRLISGQPLSNLVRPPLLSVEPESKYACEAREGETVTAEFKVRNVSANPVRLLGASSSCGCTVVTNDFPLELPPGCMAVLPVRMKVGRPAANGRFGSSAKLLVNSGGTVPPLVVEATVVGPPLSPHGGTL